MRRNWLNFNENNRMIPCFYGTGHVSDYLGKLKLIDFQGFI